MPQVPWVFTPLGSHLHATFQRKGISGQLNVKPRGSVYFSILWIVGASMMQFALLDISGCKEFILRGNLLFFSFHARPVSSSLTSSLISLALMACEGIEAMLRNMRMLANPTTSSFEHHSFPKITQNMLLATRGIQDGQSPFHYLCQLRKNSGMRCLSGEGILKRSGRHNSENNSRIRPS
jgi:hypothetical protein